MDLSYWIEAFYPTFYKRKAKVYLLKRTGRWVREYYDITPENTLKVFKQIDERSLDGNPSIKGVNPPLDERTLSPTYLWREGDSFVTPLGFSGRIEGEIIGTKQGMNFVRFERMRNELSKIEQEIAKNFDTIIIILVVLMLLGVLANIFVTYSIAEALDIKLF